MIKTIYELSTAVVFGATSWALKQVGNGVGAVADRILGPEPDQAAAEGVHASLDQPPVAVPELEPPSLTPGKDALAPP